ncbi:MAG: peptidase M28 family protein, partial [Flavobacteriaceae bacterium]|nr:peptidase M28 family protein [Flavobacteriaceae bacterium]
MKKNLSILLLIISTTSFFAQGTDYLVDSVMIRNIFTESLARGASYDWLNYLSNRIGPRLAGSEGDKKAVAWGKSELEKLGLDKVWLQPVTAHHWERGDKEQAHIETKFGKFNVDICALGGSIATPASGILAEVIEVKSLKEVDSLGDKVKGKIVFYNRPMPPENIETFRSYGQTVDQRYSGARVAGKYGALGVIVRSMNLKMD